jgi:hypothetical protein
MEHTTSTPLTSVQQQIVDDLAAGASFSAVAEAHHINRVTIYRWTKTIPQFKAALELSRVEFILARRDDLQLLTSRALDSLMQILENPKSSPAVLFKTARMILERNKSSQPGWCVAEPYPNGDGEAIFDSAALEREANRISDAYILAHEEEIAPEPVPEPTPEPAPEPAECNTMQLETAVSHPHVASAQDDANYKPTRADKMESFRRMQAQNRESLAEIEYLERLSRRRTG